MEHASNGVNSGPAATPHRQMPSMPSKTPVSLLQELCAKRGITPKYELMQVDGAVHEPTFLYRATVGEFIASEKGPSKKKAKHAVAKAVLDMVLGNQAGGAGTAGQPADDSLGQLVSPYDDGIAGNPVGQLQELCMAYKLPPPIYEVVQEEGQPHERTFTMLCRIGTVLSHTGVGKSKKVAKRQAANVLLTTLRENPPPEQPAPEASDAADDDQMARITAHFASLRTSTVPTLSAADSAHVSQFHRDLQNSNGSKLDQLKKNLPTTSMNCVKFLHQLAKEQKFEITWVDVEEKSMEDQYQCVVQLSSFPVAVCYGSGEDRSAARSAAALNALHYLKITTKK